MKIKESFNEPIELIESEKSTRFKSVFAIANRITRNNRIYPEKTLKRAIEEFQHRIKSQNVSFISHKGNELSDASHVLERVWYQNGKGYVQARLIPTSKGKDAQILLKSGGKIGVSLRGTGTSKENENGNEVVNPDFRLYGIDLCLNPGFEEARFSIGESVNFKGNKEYDDRTLMVNYEYARYAGFRGNYQEYKQAVNNGKITPLIQKSKTKFRTEKPWGMEDGI